MAFKSHVVSVTTTATRLDSVAENRTAGSSIAVYNDGASTVYLGGSDVTASGATKGYPVPSASGSPGFTVEDASEELYGIVASGTVSVIVIEVGV